MTRLNSKQKNLLSLKARDDSLFKNISKKPAFVLNPLKAMIKHVVDIISLQQLDYEMECVDIPDDYNFLKLDIVVTLLSVTHIFSLRKPLN